MRTYLLRLLLIAASYASSFLSYGQDSPSRKSPYQIPDPIIIINSTIIANGFFDRLDPMDIKELFIYRESNTPSLLRNLTLAGVGIVAITYDKPVVSHSFTGIARQQGVRGPFRVVLNGQTLDAAQVATLRIAPEAIGQVQVTRATSGTAEALMTIKLVEAKTDSQRHPPGTIMIR